MQIDGKFSTHGKGVAHGAQLVEWKMRHGGSEGKSQRPYIRAIGRQSREQENVGMQLADHDSFEPSSGFRALSADEVEDEV
jgi:hypothetical protein